MTNTNCPFCDMTQSYRFISESENMRIIYPKSPACRFHVLITPKRHVQQIDGLTDAEFVELRQILKDLVGRVKQALPDFIGYNIVSNNGGPAVRQQVLHCHLHVLLRMASEKADPLSSTDSGNPQPLTELQLEDMKQLQGLFDGKLANSKLC